MARFQLLANWRGHAAALRSFDWTRIKPMQQATHSLAKVPEAPLQICSCPPFLASESPCRASPPALRRGGKADLDQTSNCFRPRGDPDQEPAPRKRAHRSTKSAFE